MGPAHTHTCSTVSLMLACSAGGLYLAVALLTQINNNAIMNMLREQTKITTPHCSLSYYSPPPPRPFGSSAHFGQH